VPTAFALRADHENVFAGGTLHVNNETVDLAQRLADGNGVIVVQDNESLLDAALRDNRSAFKQVPLSHAETAAAEADEPRRRPRTPPPISPKNRPCKRTQRAAGRARSSCR
jgi:hypothetical protein